MQYTQYHLMPLCHSMSRGEGGTMLVRPGGRLPQHCGTLCKTSRQNTVFDHTHWIQLSAVPTRLLLCGPRSQGSQQWQRIMPCHDAVVKDLMQCLMQQATPHITQTVTLRGHPCVNADWKIVWLCIDTWKAHMLAPVTPQNLQSCNPKLKWTGDLGPRL